jgi:hypothetical protein
VRFALRNCRLIGRRVVQLKFLVFRPQYHEFNARRIGCSYTAKRGVCPRRDLTAMDQYADAELSA